MKKPSELSSVPVKSKKRGILARAADKINQEQKKDEENDALLEEAISDPSYQAEIKSLTVQQKKKEIKIQDEDKKSEEEIVAEALLNGN